jgi:hypothetical protein
MVCHESLSKYGPYPSNLLFLFLLLPLQQAIDFMSFPDTKIGWLLKEQLSLYLEDAERTIIIVSGLSFSRDCLVSGDSLMIFFQLVYSLNDLLLDVYLSHQKLYLIINLSVVYIYGIHPLLSPSPNLLKIGPHL